MEFKTIEEFEESMSILGFTQPLIDQVIGEIKGYRFIIDGIPTNELTLTQFLDNIEVEYEDKVDVYMKHYGECSKRTVSDFEYLVHNKFYPERKRYDLISVCSYLSCQSIFGGIPEDSDNDFRML